MVFIELTLRIGNKVLINIANITNIIDYANCPGRQDDENTRIYTNDADYTAVKETYKSIKEALSYNQEIQVITKI